MYIPYLFGCFMDDFCPSMIEAIAVSVSFQASTTTSPVNENYSH